MENKKVFSRDELFLIKLKEAVLNNLENEQFGVTELSKAVAISRFQLHRKLKVLKGISASQFIREVRLEEALKMLQADVATAAEIGYRVGFSSPSYFNKCFQDFYGISPGEARNNSVASVKDNMPETYPEKTMVPDAPGNASKRTTFKILLIGAACALAIGVILVIYLVSSKPKQFAVAVLPLNNLTGQEERDYFVNGMHDALIGELGKISALRVISRTSTLRYRQSEMLLQDIARELDVDAIIEGSVYGTGDSVRIQLQLIEAFPKERHLWAKEYHENIRNALAMHSLVVHDIAKEIQVTVSPQEEIHLSNVRQVNPETYEAYLRGMYHLNQATPHEVELGMSYFHQAIRIDPDDPLPWAGLAIGYSILGHGPSPEPDTYSKAKTAADKALALDETLAEAHLAIAMIALYHDWDWPVAEKGFKRALEINPNLAEAHTHYAWYKMLCGEMDQVLIHSKKATELDPFSVLYSSYLGNQYWWLGDYDKSLRELERTLQLEPNDGVALYTKGNVYAEKGRIEEAIAVHRQAYGVPSNQWRWTLGYTYAIAGRQEEARKIAEEIKSNPKPIDTWGLTEIYAALDEKDEAFRWLQEGFRLRFSWIPWMAWYPNYQSLRDDPRFETMVKELNLPVNQ